MSHIEVLGPPGTGKSTIHEILTESNDIYGGYSEDAYSRYFIANHSGFTEWIFKNFPEDFKYVITKKLLSKKYQHQSFELFFKEYPEVIRLMALASELVKRNDIEAPGLIRKVSDYQVSNITTKSNEILFLDQSFHQRLMGYLWRLGPMDYPHEDYLDAVPTPKILINFVCPPETALERQQKRGRITVNKPWVDSEIAAQESLHEICGLIAEYQASKTNVIEISTATDVATSLNRLAGKLESFGVNINMDNKYAHL